jgi:hypothetical protein
MKRLIMIAGMVVAFGLGSAAAFAATSDKPPAPPGQPDCEHGNSQKPCKDDPQPNHGQDCEEHGNQGGQNEDHCKTDTTPTETTPTETTTTTETTPAGTTPTITTPGETPSSPSGSSSTVSPVDTGQATQPVGTESDSTPQAEQEGQVFTPPTSSKPAQRTSAAVAAASGTAAAPSTAAQQAPFTP